MVWFTSTENPHDDPVVHWRSLVERRLIARTAEMPRDIALGRARVEAQVVAPHRRPAHRAGAVTYLRREHRA